MPKTPRPQSPAALQRRRAASVSRTLCLFAEACRARLMKEFDARGLPSANSPHVALIRNLDPYEEVSLSELARRAGVSRQAMQKLARKLERSGHVQLVSDVGDRRRLSVRFTTRGRAMIRESLKVYERFDVEFAAAIGPRRLKELSSVLHDLATKWDHS